MKVMAFGTFDLLHEGHKYFLQKAKEYGNKLVVVVARDTNVKKIKGCLPAHNELQRLHAVQELKFVDKAVLGDETDFFKPVELYKPDILCFGYDQHTHNAVYELKKRKISVETVTLPAYKPEQYKSSLLRKKKQ